MNERIKELIKAAGLNIDGYGYPIWGCLDGEDEKKAFLEKFAELIVQECVALVEKQDHGTSDLWVSQWDSACRAVSKDIKEHFGVE
jgi:hypothetical protein